MKDDLNHKWYTAKDIKKFLSITPGQLFHWGRTWGLITPEIKAEGRQGKDKYSFRNLLFLSLIKELLSFGLDLRAIKKIISIKRPFPHGGWKKMGERFEKAKSEEYNFYDIFDYAKRSNTYLFEFIKVGKQTIPEQVRSGLHLPKDLDWIVIPVKEAEEIALFAKSALIVNLSHIVTELEEKTGEEL